MKTMLFDRTVITEAQEAMDFMATVLDASTEYSIIGTDMDDRMILWNEGTRHELTGKKSALLHTLEDIHQGVPRKILDTAMQSGKGEGTLTRVRKAGQPCPPCITVTLPRYGQGKPIVFLLISRAASLETQLTEEFRAVQFYTRSLIEALLDPLVAIRAAGKLRTRSTPPCRSQAYQARG